MLERVTRGMPLDGVGAGAGSAAAAAGEDSRFARGASARPPRWRRSAGPLARSAETIKSLTSKVVLQTIEEKRASVNAFWIPTHTPSAGKDSEAAVRGRARAVAWPAAPRSAAAQAAGRRTPPSPCPIGRRLRSSRSTPCGARC